MSKDIHLRPDPIDSAIYRIPHHQPSSPDAADPIILARSWVPVTPYVKRGAL